MRRRWMVLAGGAGLAIGVVAGFVTRALLAPEPADVAARPAQGLDAARGLAEQVGRLREEVAAQRTLTSALQAELTRLRERIDVIDPDGTVAAIDGAPASSARAETRPRRGAPWFDAGQLLVLDMDPGDVTRVRQAFDAHELEILFLRDRATREGWAQQPRFRNEMITLRSGFREEIGDADYDALLWATGRSNRVELATLLGGSPAVAAGLENGDVVLRYDDQEIFDGQSLQRATRTGEPGSTVALDVLRGDEELRLYVPRGPLGAQLRPTRTPPGLE